MPRLFVLKPTSTSVFASTPAMFDLPETKRVRRSELFPTQSRSPSPPLDTNIGALKLDLDFITVAPTAPVTNAQKPQEEDGEIDFQLFSSATRPQQKITLKDPTPPPSLEDAWERLAQTQKRPEGYYVLSEADMVARRQVLKFQEVVVSAEDVIKDAEMVWPGCRVPWKVTTIITAPAPLSRKSGKRTKPGKKRRIYLRKEEKKKKAAEEARLKSIAGRKKFAGLPKEEREAKEREERNRRNREKKIKRRIREKAKKEVARAAGSEVKEVDSSGKPGGEKGRVVDVEMNE